VNDQADHKALIKAAFNGDVATVRAMLNQGCDPNYIPQEGLSPLHAAMENLELAVATTLLDAGADPNLRDNTGWTPLFHAVETACGAAQQVGNGKLHQDWMALISLLVRKGADARLTSPVTRADHLLNKRITNQMLPAEIARKCGQSELAALLEEAVRNKQR
jgi:ankyrin repeat protein